MDAGLSGARPIEEAMAEYEQRRNEVAFPIYEFTSQLANLEEPPPPEMRQLFGALRGHQADTDRFLGVLTGTTSAPAFYAPENVGRIMGAAQAAV